MHDELWSFSLDLYARPGVEQACLRLQASGANVCVLLCGTWLMGRKVACNARRVEEIGQLAAPWEREVVRPLRDLRTQWRDAARQDPQLGVLRERIKGLELDAERELLIRLEALTKQWPVTEKADANDWLTGLAGEAANQHYDALQVLRVAMNQA